MHKILFLGLHFTRRFEGSSRGSLVGCRRSLSCSEQNPSNHEIVNAHRKRADDEKRFLRGSLHLASAPSTVKTPAAEEETLNRLGPGRELRLLPQLLMGSSSVW